MSSTEAIEKFLSTTKEEEKFLLKAKRWKTITGREIPVEEMSDRHIRRILEDLESGGFEPEWESHYGFLWWGVLEEELIDRGVA